MIIAAFLLMLAASLCIGAWIAIRSARIDRDVRGEEICIEAERAERGLYARWWIS